MEKTISCRHTVDLILFNGKIFGGDSNGNVYEAIAVCGDKIYALGTSADILALKECITTVIDLEGKTVIPGLIDSHTHFSSAALTEVRGEFFIPGSVKELLDQIRWKVTKIKKGEWLYFGGVYPTRLEELRYPTLQELDEAAPDHPVYIDGAFAGQANAFALKLAGIDEKTRPGTGTICIDENTGKINGRLITCGHLVKNCIVNSSYTKEEVVKAIEMLQKEYNRLGITSVIDAATSLGHINAYNTLYLQKKLNIRLVYSFVAPKEENVGTEVSAFRNEINTPAEWGKLTFMKIFLDGGILTGTSYMRKPFKEDHSLFGISDSMYRGFIGYTKEKLVRYIQKACEIGLQMTAHCAGDAATDRFVEAYIEVNHNTSIISKRFSIIHANFTDIKTLQRIKRLGLTLISQPAWHYKDADVISRVLEEDAMNTFLPYSDMELLDVNVSAGSDHMMKHDSFLSQNPYNPYLGLYNLITRKTWKGELIHPEQRVSRRTALKMYTENAAYASFDDKLKGTLEVGKLADMAVLSSDYFTCSEEELPFIESELTIVGGRIVYKKEKVGDELC